MSEQAKQEFEAIQKIHSALEPLEESARTRVLDYIANLMQIPLHVSRAPSKSMKAADGEGAGSKDGEAELTNAAGSDETSTSFSTLAELYDAAAPKTNGEKALVVGYWLQVCQSGESFTAQSANKELAHLGHKIANITAALDDLKAQKPALVLQLKKSGSSRQARKTYKLSHAGVKKIQEMIGG